MTVPQRIGCPSQSQILMSIQIELATGAWNVNQLLVVGALTR